MSFDWQTEETVDWEEPPPPAPEPEEPPPSKRHRFWAVGLLLLLVVVGVMAGSRLLAQQVDKASENAESDLLASYAVIENAARTADDELFATFLSGRDEQWTNAYTQLVANGNYYDLSQFGLTWQEVDDPMTAVISTTINPTFDAAEIVTARDYAVDVGHGFTQTMHLQHTAVYRLGQDRWLLAPPEPEFWGETLTKKGYYLTLTFPERDKVFADKLALELDTKLAELCGPTILSCEDGFQVEVEFVTTLNRLDPSPPLAFKTGDGVHIELPAPGLVGLPLTETDFEVLSRGYVDRITVLTPAALAGFECCWDDLSTPATIAFQQVRLGLRPYPLTAVDWQAVSELSVSLEGGVSSGADRDQIQIVTYAFTDFLLNGLHVPLSVLLSTESNGEQISRMLWLMNVTQGRYSEAELEDKWQQFVQKKANQETLIQLTPQTD